MKQMTWSRSTSPAGEKPVIVSEYLLNELGIFVKREKRMPKKPGLTALTGFRVGYAAVPGTDYRAAPLDRTAILWHKITAVKEAGPDRLIVSGNQEDRITLCFDPDDRDMVMDYVATKRREHPPVRAADYAAAAWLCWRDDDDWGDAPGMSLAAMVAREKETERFIEPEVLAETHLAGVREAPLLQPAAVADDGPKCCQHCGAALIPEGKFCPQCGSPNPAV
ncbi:MAG: hypothetical protein ABGU93_02880 [Acetobacterium sp.]|uniref:hypothetical protein n=1 Tax=Acetobacterium sp. TaxID=1872094 RepID=UPI0032423873